MPMIFIGHGSPMNAIESNIYTESWRDMTKFLQEPRAILIFSAHWITEWETWISTALDPQMIYDMWGFPPDLYRAKYTAKGSPEIAEEIIGILEQKNIKIRRDTNRGFDHGIWSSLMHLFPTADIPVISISLDYRSSPRDLMNLWESLSILRSKWILIIGTGNIVHNLWAIDWSWEHIYPWAIEFDKRIADGIVAGKDTPKFENILDFQSWGEIACLAQPSYDHLLPLFPLLGASETDDVVEFYTPAIVMGSLSMRSVIWKS